LSTALLSTLLALPLAWILARSNLSRAKTWRSLFCLPYAIPPYIGAMAWITLANPTNGLLNLLFGTGSLNIYSFFGLVWVMSSFFYTFVLLSLLQALDRVDPSLEEAARLSGAGPIRVFFQITLPIIWPSLMSGFILVALASAATFGVPAMIGNPARIFLITTKIYTFQQTGSLQGIYMAGSLSLALLVMAIMLLVANQVIISRGSFKSVSGKTSRPSLVSLGRFHHLTVFSLCLGLFLLFVLPVCAITISALSSVPGIYTLDNMSFANFHRVFFEIDETPRAFANSLKLAAGAATVTTLLGLMLAYLKVKTRLPGRRLIELFASIPYATPGTVLAFALILAFSRGVLGLEIPLYNTLILIGIAFTAKFLNFSLRTCADGLSQIDDVLAEAARVSGANWLTVMRTVWLPLLRPALVASWFLVFMPAMTDLTMTILLTGPGLETLGTIIFQLQSYADSSGGGASVLALVSILGIATTNLIVKIASKGKYGL
jgi:iron(III) transport system permease protein